MKPEAATFPTIISGFGYSPLEPAFWRTDATSGLSYRDLSIASASDDAFVGYHLRTLGHVRRVPLADADTRFVFIFVLAGRAVLHPASSAPIELNALDSATRYGAGTATEIEMAHDAEVLVLSSRKDAASEFGEGGSGNWQVSRESEDSYFSGDGPRKFFRYRNLGVDAATDRRIHIHIVRATTAPEPGGTGYHSHSMGQLFYVLRGWADVIVQDRPSVRAIAGDAMCIAPRMGHDVPDFSPDYLVLEMCIPADYDTVDQVPDDTPILG